MRLARYTPADFAALYALEEACFDPPVRFPRAQMRRLLERQRGVAWLLWDEADQLLGFGIAGWRREQAGLVGYIDTLEVASAARGQGCGGQLLAALMESAHAAGCVLVWLHVAESNTAARALYERHGFRVVGREKDYYQTPGEDALICVAG